MIKTNLNKTKEEIIYELLLSLNNGDSGYHTSSGNADPRIKLAIAQYNALVENGIVKEEDESSNLEKYSRYSPLKCNHDWELRETYMLPDYIGKPHYYAKYTCYKCGTTDTKEIGLEEINKG